ncbi:MAG: DUF2255 family protein [Chloroflexi bacterium]|nr:MAG: DUF2255 family protein [Chloroflexota bacterium]
MTAWATDELTKMGRAEEIEIAVSRADGQLHNRVTVWAVPHGDALYVRSAVKGRNAAWFRAVPEMHEGRIWAGGLEKDIAFEDADHDIDDEVDAAYRSKYRRYAGRILNSCLTPEARSTTIKIVPR